jgi:hypothetical protein
VWHQGAPEPERILSTEAPQAVAVGEPGNLAATCFAATRESAVPRTKAPRRSWAERLGLIAGWTGLAAVLVLIGWMGLRFRHEIETLWPQSSAVYATFGIKVNSGAIEINDVTYRPESENGKPVFEISVKLVNVSSHEAPVPRLRVAFTDDAQREVYQKTYSPPLRILGVGQSVGLLMKMRDTPPAAKHLQLHFAGRD